MILIGVIAVAGLVLAYFDTAHGQPLPTVCHPHNQMIYSLEHHHNEELLGNGIMNKGMGVIEVYTHEDGSWTIAMSLPNGLSCMMAHGEGWSAERIIPAGPKIPRAPPGIDPRGRSTL